MLKHYLENMNVIFVEFMVEWICVYYDGYRISVCVEMAAMYWWKSNCWNLFIKYDLENSKSCPKLFRTYFSSSVTSLSNKDGAKYSTRQDFNWKKKPTR